MNLDCLFPNTNEVLFTEYIFFLFWGLFPTLHSGISLGEPYGNEPTLATTCKTRTLPIVLLFWPRIFKVDHHKVSTPHLEKFGVYRFESHCMPIAHSAKGRFDETPESIPRGSVCTIL